MKITTVSLKAFFVFLGLIFFVFLSALSLWSPRPVAETASPKDFSSGRAMKHLRIISKEPHYWGTAANAEVRNYISSELKKLGIDAEIQEKTFPYFTQNRIHQKTVFNIIARIRGTQNSKTVLLIAHYDSAPESPGASDGGAGVVALMEAARAIQSGPRLKNDIIFLFTDGHEPGMFGAKAFVEGYPDLENIGPVFQLGARGSGGPVALAYIGGGNSWMVKELKKAVPYILSTSLSSGVFNLLPYYSDLMILDGEGLMGAHYAYGGDYFTYHNRLDTVETISERNVQNFGRIALDIAKHFGNLDIKGTRGRELIFFNIPGILMIHYPQAWTKLLLILVHLLFIAVFVVGFKKRLLRGLRIGLGFLSFLINILVILGFAVLLWFIFRQVYPGKDWMLQYEYRQFLVGFAAMTVFIFSFLYRLIRKTVRILEFAVAGMIPWLLLAIVVGLTAPAASYIFLWPLLFSLIALGAAMFLKDPHVSSLKILIAHLVCSLPGIFIITPLVILFYQALQMSQFCVVFIMILVTLLLYLLIPLFSVMEYPKRWWLPALSLAVAALFFSAGIIGARDYADYPKIEASYVGRQLTGRLSRRIRRRLAPPPASAVSPLDQLVGHWQSESGIHFYFGKPEIRFNDFAGSFIRVLADGRLSQNAFGFRGEDRTSSSISVEIFWNQEVLDPDLKKVKFYIDKDGKMLRLVKLSTDGSETEDHILLKRISSQTSPDERGLTPPVHSHIGDNRDKH